MSYDGYLSPTYKPNENVTKQQHKGKMWAVGKQISVKLNRIGHFLKTLFSKAPSEWINNKYVLNQIQKDISEMQGRISAIRDATKSSKDEGESIQDIHNNIQQMREVCNHLKAITISSKKDQQLLGKVEQQINSLETAVPNIQTLVVEQLKTREPLRELVTDQKRDAMKANVKKVVSDAVPGLDKESIPEYQSVVKSLQELYKPRSEGFSKTANSIADVADIETPSQPSAILAQTALRILQATDEQSPPSVESEVAVVSPEQEKLNEQRKEIEGDIRKLYERVKAHPKATFLTGANRLRELVNQDFSGLSLKKLKEKVLEIQDYVGKVLEAHKKAGLQQTQKDLDLNDDFTKMTADICKRIDVLINARGTEEVVKDKPEELEEVGKETTSPIDVEKQKAIVDTLDWDVPTLHTISDQFQSLVSTIEAHQPNYFSKEDLSTLKTLVAKDLSKMSPRDLMDHLDDIGNLLSNIYHKIPVKMSYAAYKESKNNDILDDKLGEILLNIENDIERISRDQVNVGVKSFIENCIKKKTENWPNEKDLKKLEEYAKQDPAKMSVSDLDKLLDDLLPILEDAKEKLTQYTYRPFATNFDETSEHLALLIRQERDRENRVEE